MRSFGYVVAPLPCVLPPPIHSLLPPLIRVLRYLCLLLPWPLSSLPLLHYPYPAPASSLPNPILPPLRPQTALLLHPTSTHSHPSARIPLQHTCCLPTFLHCSLVLLLIHLSQPHSFLTLLLLLLSHLVGAVAVAQGRTTTHPTLRPPLSSSRSPSLHPALFLRPCPPTSNHLTLRCTTSSGSWVDLARCPSGLSPPRCFGTSPPFTPLSPSTFNGRPRSG